MPAVGAARGLQAEVSAYRRLEEVEQLDVLRGEIDAAAVRRLDEAVAGQQAQHFGKVGVQRGRATRQSRGVGKCQRQRRIGFQSLPLGLTGPQALAQGSADAQHGRTRLPLRKGVRRDAVARAELGDARARLRVVVDCRGNACEDAAAATDLDLLSDAQLAQLDPASVDEDFVILSAVEHVAVPRLHAHTWPQG